MTQKLDSHKTPQPAAPKSRDKNNNTIRAAGHVDYVNEGTINIRDRDGADDSRSAGNEDYVNEDNKKRINHSLPHAEEMKGVDEAATERQTQRDGRSFVKLNDIVGAQRPRRRQHSWIPYRI